MVSISNSCIESRIHLNTYLGCCNLIVIAFALQGAEFALVLLHAAY